jgi:hypothetical protein
MSDPPFPIYSRQRQVGEAGMNAVSTLVNDHFKWIFRRVGGEFDYGVDGYIDIVTSEGKVTGQSIAVQIKTGASFFKVSTASSFTFYGETRHLNYYLNLPTPLLIVLYDEDSKRLYWTDFDAAKTEPTDRGWTIGVSKRSDLANAQSQLLEIVGPIVEHTDAVSQHWALNKALTESDVVLYAVDREDVESGNVEHLKAFRDRLCLSDTLLLKLQGHVDISISGYEDDPRELWEISEVIDWFKKADDVFQDWFYLLRTKKPSGGLKSYLTCLCSPKSERRDFKSKRVLVSIDTKKMTALFEKNFVRLNEMTDRLGLSVERNKEITFAIFDLFNIPHGK